MTETILVVDDEPLVRDLLARQVAHLGYACEVAGEGREAYRIAARGPQPALVLLDIEMPGLSGLEILKWLKTLYEDLQVIMVSGLQDLDTVRTCLREGAYDFIVKPFELEDLANAIGRALERGRLIRQNREYRENLERMVQQQTAEIRQTRDIALLTLAKLAESRDAATGLHLERMAAYSRRLAEALHGGPYGRELSAEFVDHLFESSPLHDIGKVGIPDAILCKPGPLTAEEQAVMRTHTTIGGDTLRTVIERHGGHSFLTMAMEICYSHHERWDGGGYPAGRIGTDNPLAARVVGLADAYDAITSVRPYKPAFDHLEAVRRITTDRGHHFDPVIVDAFLAVHPELPAIRQRLADEAAAWAFDTAAS